MSTVVLDASALLALLFAESGGEEVAEAVASGAAASTVNLSEVAAVVTRRGRDARRALGPVTEQIEVLAYELDDAFATADLAPTTSTAGLSLGHRTCLALASRLGLPALTADRAWLSVPSPAVVRCIRPG